MSDTPPYTDEELARRAARGDPDAAEALVLRYEQRLYGLIVRILGRPGPEAENLFQETWLHAMRALSDFDPGRRFSTWLFQIAVNQCRDRWRREATEKKARPALEAGAGSAAADGQDMALEKKEDILKLRSFIEHLPHDQREVLVLRYYHQLSEKEVAEIVGCPAGTVKSRMHHAIQKLRRQYREAEDPV